MLGGWCCRWLTVCLYDCQWLYDCVTVFLYGCVTVACPQVLTKAVKPPTPDAAKLAAVVSQQALAMQHVRMQLARLIKRAHPAQVRQEAHVHTYTHRAARTGGSFHTRF